SFFFFFSSRRRHTRFSRDWSSDVCSSDLTYLSNNVVIATGFYDIPNKMNVPGEDLNKVSHYYKDPHFYSSQKVAVIGASNSAIEIGRASCRERGKRTEVAVT